MNRSIGAVTFLVREYDEAIDFFVGSLGFSVVEDTPIDDSKRWVVVKPPSSSGASLLLGRAVSAEQSAHVGPTSAIRQAAASSFFCTPMTSRPTMP